MWPPKQWFVLSILLAGVGIAVFVYKITALGFPTSVDAQSATWTVEARVQIDARGEPTKVQLALPSAPPGFQIKSESFISRGFGRHTVENGTRKVEWTKRRTFDDQTLYYSAIVFDDIQTPGYSKRPAFPGVPQLDEPYQTALLAITEQMRAQSADIASYAAAVIRRIQDDDSDDNLSALLRYVQADQVALAQLLLAGANIPTQKVHVALLRDRASVVEPKPMLAVYTGDSWLYFDPESAEQGLQRGQFIWWRGDGPVATASGAQIEDIQFSVRQNSANALELAQRRAQSHAKLLASFSLLDLPLNTQSVYSVLLMIPIGAFVIVLLRNFIGVRSFGTFMPVLIALAFRETQLLAGIILFTVITGLGLAIRFYLEHMRLLLVPRLASVLTIVVLLMLIVSLVSHKLGIEVGLSVALFPMVILAMVIERMSIVWEERGGSEAIVEGLGSLAIAAAAYLIMGIDLLNHLVFVFPELLLCLLALTIACGRYTGYRLSELIRFRELA